MFLLVEGINIEQTIKIALLTSIPVVVLVTFWLFLKNQIDNEKQTLSKKLETMDEQVLSLAREKLAQREQTNAQNPSEKRLSKEEIEAKLKTERDEYNEFELVEPLQDLNNPEEKNG